MKSEVVELPWGKVKVKAIDAVKSIHVLGDLDDDLRTGLAFAQVRFPAWETCGLVMVPSWGWWIDSLAKRYMVRFEALKLKLAQHFNVCCFTRCWLQEVLNCYTWQLHHKGKNTAPARTGSTSQNILTSSMVAGESWKRLAFPQKKVNLSNGPSISFISVWEIDWDWWK